MYLQIQGCARKLGTTRTLQGNPSQRSLMAVNCFFSPIFSYFCLLVAALSPCHGKPPRRKYMKTWPSASRSSRRDCSRPKCVLMDHVSCGARETLALAIRYVLFRLGISILFSHAKVNHMNNVCSFGVGSAN